MVVTRFLRGGSICVVACRAESEPAVTPRQVVAIAADPDILSQPSPLRSPRD